MKIFGFIFCLVVFSNAHSQTADSIRTGRPGQAIGPYVLGTGILQWQAGFDQIRTQSPGSDTTQLVSNNIVRFGLSESFEVSSLIDYTQREQSLNGHITSGLSQFHFGFRYNLVAQPDGWLPALGLQTRLRFPGASQGFRTNELAPVHLLAFVYKLTDKLNWTTNAGVSYDGVNPEPTYNYVINLSHPIGEDWSLSYDFWGNENRGVRQTYLGVGIGYVMNKDFQWDGYISSGHNHGVDFLYVSLGFSWRWKVL